MVQESKSYLPEIVNLGKELEKTRESKGEIFNKEDYQELTTPGLNPAYGLSFWLNQNGVDAENNDRSAFFPACSRDALIVVVNFLTYCLMEFFCSCQ